MRHEPSFLKDILLACRKIEAIVATTDEQSFLKNEVLSAAILHHLGISRVRLLSHNPNKTRALLNAGISVVAQVPCEAEHTLSLGSAGPDSDRNTQRDPASTEANHVGSEDEFERLFPACRRGSIADFAEELQ